MTFDELEHQRKNEDTVISVTLQLLDMYPDNQEHILDQVFRGRPIPEDLQVIFARRA